MSCTECGRGTIAFEVPEDLRRYVPENASAAATCVSCLTLQPPVPDADTPAEPDLSRISDALPEDERVSIPVVLLVGLLSSLALNRPKIEDLLAHIEDQGVDPLLILDRLADDPELDPAMDLRGRRRQMEQLLF